MTGRIYLRFAANYWTAQSFLTRGRFPCLLPAGDRRGRVLADIARLPQPASTTFIGAT
jgi:hypothetical protein